MVEKVQHEVQQVEQQVSETEHCWTWCAPFAAAAVACSMMMKDQARTHVPARVPRFLQVPAPRSKRIPPA